jgi:hypothetical protein
MGKDFERSDIGAGRENASKNGSKMRSKTVRFSVEFSAQNDAENGSVTARSNALEGGGKPRDFVRRKGVGIDDDRCMDSRFETHTKPRADLTQKIVARDAENAAPNTRKAVLASSD